jgi:hypothetical protein
MGFIGFIAHNILDVMTALVARQSKFLLDVCKLVSYATACGYSVTIGEAERTKEQATIYAKQGKGIADSMHCQRFAIDLNFYDAKTGKYIEPNRENLARLGAFWGSLGRRWGGMFKSLDDSRHFEE